MLNVHGTHIIILYGTILLITLTILIIMSKQSKLC